MLQHVVSGFASPPKEGVLRIFYHTQKSTSFGQISTREP
jgi:hypothetical protein